MTLQTSGAISMDNLRNEFGLSGSVSLSSFYGKGGAQGSGTISIGDFYGRSNVTFTVDSVPDAPDSAHFAVTASVAVTWTYSYSKTGTGTVTVNPSASGATQTAFSIEIDALSGGGVYRTGGVTGSVTATYSGGSRTWTISLSVGTN